MNMQEPLDLTFIVNERGKTLKDRFEKLIKDCKYFDALVAYFYVSGFHLLYKALEKTEKIRILIGIGTDRKTYDLISSASQKQNPTLFSHAEAKNKAAKAIEKEMENSEDSKYVEEGIRKFIEWINEGKLEIRAYPSQDIHAKLYIITFKEGDRDIGRVITGSSNFTQSGLVDNLEFNVELKNSSDYKFAKEKFEQLWKESVELSDEFVQTINQKTWLKDDITPYELYLKFLYEYFKEELERPKELQEEQLQYEDVPQNFIRLRYQEQAVLNAKKILEEYGGCFISDVVGLGKTYICAMLAKQLKGRTMIIAPPALLNRNNPGSWPNVFSDFRIPAEFVSIGKLEEAKKYMEQREYKNIIIDESHRFRNETTISYEKISEICRGKRVILVSATPYNNSPNDIFNQIKLFQPPRNSKIPGVPNLEKFFREIEIDMQTVDRNDEEEYLKKVNEVAKEIRDKVLKYIMVRRTRSEIEKYFADDLEKNKIKFPEVEAPKPVFYQLSPKEDKIFMDTVELITQNLKYTRYMPLLYLKKPIAPLEVQSQRNMGAFMKVLLVKRLESSFYAFRRSIERFIRSYEMFIKAYKNGYVYVSKRYINKIFELLEQGDDEEIQRLLDEGGAERYEAKEFREDFIKDLKHDLNVLENIKSMWETIKRDPKLETLLKNLEQNKLLKNKKLIIFTESKETAEYLTREINKKFGEITLLYHGEVSEKVRDEVIENFDASAKNKKDDYRILVSTEVLSEGVNLHRSNIIINYDIPWNPTRLMQRVGRVNRIGTSFDKIYTFNFFPTEQADSEIDLTRIARSKIVAFLTMLGSDSAILTEGEPVASHKLFDKLLSKETLTQEEQAEESELKYLRIIEEVRDKNPELFEKIKSLPKKARSAKHFNKKYREITEIAEPNSLITFFRKGKLMKFFLSNTTKDEAFELDFLTAAKIFESSSKEKRTKIHFEEYYELLNKNKDAFHKATVEELTDTERRGGSSKEKELLKTLKAIQKTAKHITEEQKEYFRKVIQRIEEGSLPKKTVQRTSKALDKLEEIQNSSKVIEILKKEIPPALLESHYSGDSDEPEEKTEVILSLYLTEQE